MKIALVLGDSAASKLMRSSGSAHFTLPAEALERMIELVDRAAIKLGRGDEFVARLHERMERYDLGRMA